MVVVALVGILLGVGVPNLRDFVLNNRLTAHANSLVTSINAARSTAISQGVNAFMTAEGGAAGNEWHEGWTVWADINGNAAIDPGEAVRVVEKLSGSTTLDSDGVTQLQYSPQGLLNAGDGTITICDDRSGETGRRITILPTTGRVSMNSDYSCP